MSGSTRERQRRAHPLLLQLNTRVLLQELSESLQRPATLDDIPDEFIVDVARRGFDDVWMMGVWETGTASLNVSRTCAGFVADVASSLPDFRVDDIAGSPFAIHSDEVHPAWGGAQALARLRERLHHCNIGLVLDFVPNHVSLDHPWVDSHPEFLVRGTWDDLRKDPANYIVLPSRGEDTVFAHGRDPFFPGWPDTLQVDFRHPEVHRAMLDRLAHIADQCDGVRCDMAMLLCPDVIVRTWGCPAALPDGTPPTLAPFWPAAIAAVRDRHPEFIFIAEVYWNKEAELQRYGFDFTYDKALYDFLKDAQPEAARRHLAADDELQRRSVRFLENHDEPRAAVSFDPPSKHRAAAVIAQLAPGMRFFHHGQTEGRRIKVSVHAGRRAQEPIDPAMIVFYDSILACLRDPTVHEGLWRPLDCLPAWEGNTSHHSILAFSWRTATRTLLVAVNYAPQSSQGYVPLELSIVPLARIELIDRLSEHRYTRDAQDLVAPGLYLDLPSWGHHVFEVRQAHSTGAT